MNTETKAAVSSTVGRHVGAFPLQCVECGRFLGKDGYPRATGDCDPVEVDPLCGPCGRKIGYKDLRPIRCPKCRSLDISLVEHITCYSRWHPGEEKGWHGDGEYFKVTGECNCGHHWTLRGYVQVWTELRERLAENARLMANATHDGRRTRRTVDGIVGNLNGGE